MHEPSAEEIQALVDRELSPEAAERVRLALTSSESALAELEDCLQLVALAHEIREQAAAEKVAAAEPVPEDAAAPVIPLVPGPRQRPRSSILRVTLTLAAAAALAMLVVEHERDPNRGDPATGATAAFAGALAPQRSIEPRLSWPGADRYRPYDTARAGAGERAVEVVPFELLGRLEKLGDPRALIAGQLLIGNPTQAARALAGAAPSPDADSDRAAVALATGKPEDALLAAARALEAEPAHPQAAWNRALALEQLEMPLTAAEGFAAVAERGEPGWSREASDRATDLRAQFGRRRTAWDAVRAAGARLVGGGPVEWPMVKAYPGIMRGYFYDAVRAAGSVDRVRALRSLAEDLDALHGGRHLTDYVDRIARADFDRRGPLAARYVVLAQRKLADRRAVRALIDALRAAGQADMLLGALVHGGSPPGQVAAADLDEYESLARETGDPWFALFAEEERGAVAIGREDLSAADAVLSAAAARCELRGPDAIDVRCLRILRLLTMVDVALHRPAAAARVLARARKIARLTGELAIETDLLSYLNTVAAQRDDTTASLHYLADAYLDEWSRQSSDCDGVQVMHEKKALSLINQGRIDDARREMELDPGACATRVTTNRAFVLAHLLREGGDVGAVQALRREIQRLRDASGAPGTRAFLDHSEGRLLIDRAPADGRTLLRRSIVAAAAAPAGDIDAVRARSYSYSVLVEEAVARGAGGEALDLLAEQRGTRAPDRCVLGASMETAAVFAARGADGAEMATRVIREPGQRPGSQRVPAAMLAALAGCRSIDVFARQPYYGRPDLLPPGMAWQFRTGPEARETPRGPGREVIVANIDPPAELGLARLSQVTAAPGATLLEGAAATPDRVMEAAVDASFLEIHAHGLPGDDEDTSVLVLSPDAHGRYTLGGVDIRRADLRAAPVVVLAACHASAIGGQLHSTWGLAEAFTSAGARAVIASPDPILDADAAAFFAALRGRIAAGEPPAVALHDERLARGPARPTWIDRLVVFR